MMRWLRWTLGIVGAVSLAAVIAALAAWLARDLWIPTAAQAALENLVEPALGGTSSLGGATLDARGAVITDLRFAATEPERVLRDVVAPRVVVRWHPTELVGSPLAALHSLDARIERLGLRTGTAPATTPDRDGGFDPDALVDLLGRALADHLGLLPGGARIDVAELRWTTADGTELYRGPVTAVWAAAPRRSLTVTTDAGVARLTAERDALTARITIEDPDAVLQPLGAEVPAEGGRLEARIDAELDAPRASAELTWTGATLPDRGPVSLTAAASWTPDLLLGAVAARAGAVRLAVDSLEIPLDPFRPTAIRGTATLDADELEPWWGLLPDAVAAWRPRRANLSVTADDTGIEVAPGRVVADGARVTIDGGRFPRGALVDAVTTGSTTPVEGRLEITATIDEPRTIPLGTAGTLAVQGELAAVLSGTPAAVRVAGRIAAGAGSVAGVAWDALTARVDWAGDRIAVEALDVRGLTRDDAPDDATGLAVTGSATGTLGDAPSIAWRGDIDGDLAALLDGAAWTRDIGPAHATTSGSLRFDGAPLPVGTVRVADVRLGEPGGATLRASLRVGNPVDGAQRFVLDLAGTPAPELVALAAAEVPALDGFASGPIDLDLSGRWDGDGLPTADLRLSARDLRTAQLAESVIDVRASLADRMLSIEDLRVSGAIDLVGEGRVPLTLERRGLDLRLDAELPAATVSSLAPDLPVHPDGRLAIRASGSLADPRLDARLTAMVDAAELVADWPTALGPPPSGPLRLWAAVRLRPGEPIDVEVDVTTPTSPTAAAVRIDIEGRAPLRIADGRLAAADGPEIGVRGLVTATIRPARLAPVSARAELAWDNRGLRVDALEIDGGRWSAGGAAEVRWRTPELLAGDVGAVGIDARLAVDRLQLERLPAAWTGLALLEGKVQASARVTGTFVRPSLEAALRVSDGRAKLAPPVPVLDDVQVALRLDDRSLQVERLGARLGVGTVSIGGTVVATGEEPLWRAWRDATLGLELLADSALILRTTGRKLRTDATLRVEGSFAAGYTVAGEIALDSGKIIERISLVPDFGKRGGTGLSTGIKLPSIPAPLGPRIRYDVELDSVEPLEIAAHVVEMPLDIAARLRGTGERPFLEGAVSAQSGLLRLPALALDIERVVVSFRPEDPAHPLIEASATGRRHGIDIIARATGPLDRVELLINSSPPLTQQELYVLVSTGVMPDTLRQQGLEGRATMVGGYLAQEVIDFYFGSDSTETGAGFVDRFHFFSGREISRNGVESLTVDFDLRRDETWVLRGERDIYEDYNMGLVWRLRF